VTITSKAKSDCIGDWGDVIADAESEILGMQRRIAELRASIKIF
jgi:hypothetical protein